MFGKSSSESMLLLLRKLNRYHGNRPNSYLKYHKLYLHVKPNLVENKSSVLQTSGGQSSAESSAAHQKKNPLQSPSEKLEIVNFYIFFSTDLCVLCFCRFFPIFVMCVVMLDCVF